MTIPFEIRLRRYREKQQLKDMEAFTGHKYPSEYRRLAIKTIKLEDLCDFIGIQPSPQSTIHPSKFIGH